LFLFLMDKHKSFKVNNFDNLWLDFTNSLNSFIGKDPTKIETYKDDKTVRPEAMYWLADCQFKNKEYVGSYQTFKKLTWDYPESKWAKISRGRLTDERFVDIESEGEE